MKNKTLKKILYIEDEKDIQIVAKLALEDVSGFHVDICSSGAEALQQIKSLGPDLILLDAMMPGLDGPSTFIELKKLDEIRDIPVIFLTAKAQGADIERLLALGAVAVLTKPFDPMTLGNQIVSIWNQLP